MKRSVIALVVVVAAQAARADEPKSFPAARHGAGELKYIDKVPELVVRGRPTVIVEKERSKTGSPIFGRNFDWLPTKGITEHTLVVVYKGEGKHAFAAVTVSPIEGVISGMNDAGLCVTMNEISIKKSKDKPEF